MDRVELAFRKFDTNNDGYLSRDEFDVVKKLFLYDDNGIDKRCSG